VVKWSLKSVLPQTDRRSCTAFSSSYADHRPAIMHRLFQVSMATPTTHIWGAALPQSVIILIIAVFFPAIMLSIAIYDRRLLREAF